MRAKYLPAMALILLLSNCGGSGQLQASGAWIRLLPGDLPAAGYVLIDNGTDKAVTLTGASSSAYTVIMIHHSVVTNGQAQMASIDKLTIPAHSQLSFKPGGYHLMLMQATHPLKVGDKVSITLHFADADALPVTFTVRPATG